jgi:hypothetical protein
MGSLAVELSTWNILGMPLCSKCGEKEPRAGGRYCAGCHAAKMREWRRTHPLLGRVLQERGHLVPTPCPCGATDVQRHHPDYSNPRLVQYLCEACHRKEHRAA